jgi:hypothetical protein
VKSDLVVEDDDDDGVVGPGAKGAKANFIIHPISKTEGENEWGGNDDDDDDDDDDTG